MIFKIKPNKGKAKGMMNLIESRIHVLPQLKKTNFPTMIAENYYEIIKELSIALLLAQGFRTAGEDFHKDLFLFMRKENIFTLEEFSIVDDLRVRRNKSFYRGIKFTKDYLSSKEVKLDEIIKKLKSLLSLEMGDF